MTELIVTAGLLLRRRTPTRTGKKLGPAGEPLHSSLLGLFRLCSRVFGGFLSPCLPAMSMNDIAAEIEI